MRYAIESKAIKKIIQIFIMFLFIYEIQITGTSDMLASRKIVVFVAIIAAAFAHENVFQGFQDNYSFLAILIYTVFITLFCAGTGEKILANVLYFYIYVCIFPPIFKKYYENIDELYTAFIGSGLIQSGIVFLQFFKMDFGKWLEMHFENGGNVEYTRFTRATGLGCEGATLGFFLAVSLVACAYFIVNKKNPVKYIIYYAFMFAASCLVSRTGLILGTVILIYALLYQAKKSVLRLIIEVAVIGVILYKGYELINANIYQMRLNYLMEWWKSVFNTGKGSSLYALNKMEIPPISLETIIGTGIRRGTSSAGTKIWNDMGYIQSYFGMGLICAAVFYLSLLKKVYKKIAKIGDKGLRYILLFWLTIIYVMELKEPFILKYIPVFFINISYFVSKREEELKKNEPKNQCNSSNIQG